jgi:hypothetical protein
LLGRRDPSPPRPYSPPSFMRLASVEPFMTRWMSCTRNGSKGNSWISYVHTIILVNGRSYLSFALLHHQVLFCTSVPATTKQMTFRQPREEDYLGSHLRRHIFQNLPRHELTLDTIFGRANEDHDPETQLLLTDDSNPLSGWQDEDALPHWQREFIDSKTISLSALNVCYNPVQF